LEEEKKYDPVGMVSIIPGAQQIKDLKSAIKQNRKEEENEIRKQKEL
jgi:hypothetical protein